MNERQTGIWFLAALGVLFVLLNLVNLVFVDGAVARDLVAIGLGGLLTIVAHARWHSWKGVRG
jgi:hypothetical protein